MRSRWPACADALLETLQKDDVPKTELDDEVDRLVAAWQPPPLPDGAAAELTEVMTVEARRWGVDRLPERPE